MSQQQKCIFHCQEPEELLNEEGQAEDLRLSKEIAVCELQLAHADTDLKELRQICKDFCPIYHKNKEFEKLHERRIARLQKDQDRLQVRKLRRKIVLEQGGRLHSEQWGEGQDPR